MLTHRKSLIGTFIKEYEHNGVGGLNKGLQSAIGSYGVQS